MGPGIKLMVDTNCPWTADQGRRGWPRMFAPHDLLWIEEPVWPPRGLRKRWRGVRQEGGVAVAAGEKWRHLR